MASELKQKTIKGLAWNTIQNFTNHGVEFLLMLFMARLLGPKEYGLIGLTTVFMAISSVFIDSGFSNALIRKKDCTNDDFSTVFIFNLFISVVCYIILFIIAPFVGDFYNEPILCPVLRVIGLLLITQAFSTVQNTILTKNIDFKKKTKITVSKNIISGLIGLLFAYFGFGVWALVIQSLTGSILFSILLWSTTEWHPNLHFSKKSFKELFGYGSKLLISSLINKTYSQINPIVIGKYFSATTLGNYSRARHWANLFSANLTSILNTVTFPVLAKVQNDDKRLENIYRRMIRTSAYIVFPSMIGLSAVAKPLTLVVIGEKWEFSAQILEIICFSMMWFPVNALNMNLLLVKGRSDLYLQNEIIKKFIALPVLFLSLPFGILVFVKTGVFASILYVFINTHYTGKFLNIGFFKQMGDLIPTLLLSLAMFGAVRFTMHFMPNLYLQLIAGIFTGAVFYTGCSYLLKLSELQEAITLFKEIKNRKKK